MPPTSRSVVPFTAPILATIVVAVLFVYLSAELHLGDGLDHQLMDASLAQIEKSRMLWGASALWVAAALTWTAVLSTYVLLSNLEDEHLVVRSLFALLLALLAYFAFHYLEQNDPSGPLATQLIHDIKMVTKVDVARLTCQGNRLAALTSCLVVLSVSSLCLPSRGDTTSDLARTIRLWTLSLYSASLLLAVGLIEIWALFRLGASVSIEDSIKPFTAVADGFALAAGLVFSLFLAAMYMPVAVLHLHWLGRHIAVARQDDPKIKIDEWLAQHGLKASPVSVGTALAAPVFAFVFTTIVKELSKSAA